MNLTSISVHLLTLELRVPFTTSFGTQKTLTHPFVVIETTDGLRGVGEVPTMTEPSYKAEADTASVLTSLREFVLPSVARYQAEVAPGVSLTVEVHDPDFETLRRVGDGVRLWCDPAKVRLLSPLR